MKITAKDNVSLLNLILENFPEVSISKAKKMIIYGCISYRGAIVKSPELIIRKGEEIEYSKYSGGRHIAREKTDVPILFEDEDIIAVLKASGVHVDARPNEKTKSLFALTKSYVRRKWGIRQNLFIVHEPETDEGGVCLFAKSRQAYNILKNTFPKTKKEYHAIVAGKPRHKNDKLNLWLKAGSKNRIFLEKQDVEGSSLCVVKYETIEVFEKYTHLLVTPETDFPFQIRFMLSNIGNPIIGDHRFGIRQISENWLKLYCTSLQLQHPITGKRIKIETSLPLTFTKINLPIFADEDAKKIELERGTEEKEMTLPIFTNEDSKAIETENKPEEKEVTQEVATNIQEEKEEQ
ncbi:MAG: pseudouridine synthase [Bacteroidales bacterium]|jgi:23S rRNA pseudouridine1911/1915/1917 synthase